MSQRVILTHFGNEGMALQLRPFQTEIIGETRSLMRNGITNILIQSPTGSGKTVTCAYMLDAAQQKGFESWFLVHRRELIKQSVRTLNVMGVPHGVIASGFEPSLNKSVQVCSVGTLARRLHKVKPPKLIVWDEAHHCAAGSWSKIHAAFPNTFHIGLTATPERLDGKGLKQWFSHMIKGPPVEWLIEQNYLCRYRAFAPSSISVAGVHTRMGDYNRVELAEAADKPTITGDAIREYQRHCPGARVVVFCVSVKHSEHVVQAFNNSGIPAAHVDGAMSNRARDAAIDDFVNGRTRVLSNVDLFGEGFDVPAIQGVIMLRPTKSTALYLQQVGRALRPDDGKDCAFILDHAGNIAQHGLPDEEREWSLDGRKKTKSEGPKVKLCDTCFYANPVYASKCEECGTPFQKGSKEREVNHVEGNLNEIDPAVIKKQRKQQERSARTLEDLIKIGRERKYKSPERWARYVFEGRKKAKAKHLKEAAGL